MGKTLFDKIWDDHVVATGYGRQCLLYADTHIVHDGGAPFFERLDRSGYSLRAPTKTFGTTDHYVPTRGGQAGFQDAQIQKQVARLGENAARHGFVHFGMGDPRQGIVHVIGPELGLTLPGMLLVCGDSHTATHGALGALAFGVGTSEAAHVLATQTLWLARPKSMRIRIDGLLASGVTSKDLILHVIAVIGADSAIGHVIEFSGTAVSALSIEARLTLCNMSIEAGARSGLIAPDEKVFSYIAGRPYAPQGPLWDQALTFWRTLRSDDDVHFDREIVIDALAVAPTVTWGTSPEDAVAVTALVPDPVNEVDPERRARRTRALDYMGLKPGMPITSIAIDRVFIGSCTNGRIEDLRAAAAVLKGRKAVVPGMVVPGSGSVKAQAEAEGLDRIFVEAGFEWRDPGCSMCVALNGIDLAAPKERCASTTNRNFVGRQGRGARTHLMSPAMAAAAAVTGHIADARQFS